MCRCVSSCTLISVAQASDRREAEICLSTSSFRWTCDGRSRRARRLPSPRRLVTWPVYGSTGRRTKRTPRERSRGRGLRRTRHHSGGVAWLGAMQQVPTSGEGTIPGYAESGYAFGRRFQRPCCREARQLPVRHQDLRAMARRFRHWQEEARDRGSGLQTSGQRFCPQRALGNWDCAAERQLLGQCGSSCRADMRSAARMSRFRQPLACRRTAACGINEYTVAVRCDRRGARPGVTRSVVNFWAAAPRAH
eukprot:1736057-Pleurochrysis_carterae.AAC.3